MPCLSSLFSLEYSMDNWLITDQAEFDDLCGHIRDAGMVAFDSEFVSEYTFRPELCLLQLATAERCVAVDPFRIESLDAWWNVMTDDETTVVVHGGQAEVRFCLDATGRPPRKLLDVQVAEGLRSRSFPVSYRVLVSRVLGRQLRGKETRTDWRRRPLSQRQINYALEDAHYILEVWRRQHESLSQLNRLEWAEAEFQRMIDNVKAEASRDGWRRLSGIHKLAGYELAVAIQLCNWREQEASRRNRPLRRVLRDDLILELARRQPANRKELLATRDMNRSGYKRAASDLLECVQRGLAIPKSELPPPVPDRNYEKNQDEHVLGKLLGIALANRCAELNVAMPLVGTSADLRHLVRWHVYESRSGSLPRLTEGWRTEVCGDLLEDVLDGKIALRVADPQSDHPLIFERSQTRPTSEGERGASAP